MASINPLISSHEIKMADDSISFEVRFIVGSHGEILNANGNGRKLLQSSKTFLDLLLPTEREKALQFLNNLSKETQSENCFFHLIDNEMLTYHYRGKKCSEGILLVGIVTKKYSAGTSLTFGHKFNEKIFSALDVGILILDAHNEIVYKNDVLVTTEKRIYKNKNLVESSPIVKKIIDMSDTIRDSKKDIQRYQMYDDQLYRMYGFFNEWDGSVVFIVDDRAPSDDYDKLLRYKQQMESVSHLAAGFAHELRNPLSVIRGFIQLSGLTNNLQRYYSTILSEIERMNQIIDDFLSLSRKAPNKEECEPVTFFQSIVDIIRSECLLRNIDLRYSFEKSDRKIIVNRSMIIQVVLNLLRNTIEAFLPEQVDKIFAISGNLVDKGYVLTIKDNGRGMDESVLKQIGKPFFTTKENGTGIGLPLCKKIIQDHGGEFNIDSALGNGTTISIFLPYSENENEDELKHD